MWPFDKPGPGPHASDLHWFPRSAYMTLESCDPVEHEQSGLNPVHYPSKIVSHIFCILIWGQHKQKGRQFSGPVFRFLCSSFSFCSYLNSYLQSVYLNIAASVSLSEVRELLWERQWGHIPAAHLSAFTSKYYIKVGCHGTFVDAQVSQMSLNTYIGH